MSWSKRLDPRVRITLDIIDEHNGSLQFDLSPISQSLGITNAHLRRLFHRDIGEPFLGYLRKVRIKKAAELLRCTPLAIKQVASECGYDDLSNFYRDFKAVCGTTPRELRFNDLDRTLTLPTTPTS